MITNQYLSLPGEEAAACGEGDVLARIAALPPRQRAGLALRYHAGQSDIEIAAVLDCSASAVRGLLAQAVATVQGAPAVVATEEAS